MLKRIKERKGCNILHLSSRTFTVVTVIYAEKLSLNAKLYASERLCSACSVLCAVLCCAAVSPVG